MFNLLDYPFYVTPKINCVSVKGSIQRSVLPQLNFFDMTLLICLHILCISLSMLSLFSEPSLSISSLTCSRWTDRNGTVRVIKIRDKIGHKWITAGDLLGLSSERLTAIDLQRRGDVGMCIRDVLVDWLHQNKGSYPTTWEGVVQLLEDMELSALAQQLKIALQFR